MPFSRTLPSLPSVDLFAALRSIGFRIGTAKPSRKSADIEVTLCAAVETALPHDYRLLGLIVAWLEAHHARVNVPRLGRIVRQSKTKPVRAFWSAMGTWLSATDSRWRAIERLYRGDPIALEDPEITAIQLQRVGSDPRFNGSALRVHAKLLRSRAADVDTPEQLAARHSQYRKRLELGANYRADVWAALEQNPLATPAQIARGVGCAYETARTVTEDFRVLQRSRGVG
jgi:hypothetical protein